MMRLWICCAAVAVFAHIAPASVEHDPQSPQPKSFTEHEFETLSVLTETIMPSGQYPGAREAEVSKFIDFQTVYDDDLRNRFKKGLTWLDESAKKRFGKTFLELKPNQRREIIDGLHYKALFRPGEEQGREFYKLARRYTDMGFYSSTAGLAVLKAPVEKAPIETKPAEKKSR